MRLPKSFGIAALCILFTSNGAYAARQEPADDADEGQESETAVQRSDLPPAVEKTVAAQAAHARIKGFSREVEHGKTFYEAELIVNGHTRDVLMDESGTIVEIEEQIAFKELPKPVQAALRKRAGRGTIRVVESLTKEGKLVAYEAHIVTGGKWSEQQVGPNGETLDHEE